MQVQTCRSKCFRAPGGFVPQAFKDASEARPKLSEISGTDWTEPTVVKGDAKTSAAALERAIASAHFTGKADKANVIEMCVKRDLELRKIMDRQFEELLKKELDGTTSKKEAGGEAASCLAWVQQRILKRPVGIMPVPDHQDGGDLAKGMPPVPC